MARTVDAHISEPPSAISSLSTDVITACLTDIKLTELATRAGSKGSTASGLPVMTEQKPQLLVQTFPKIMKVAVPSPQHSPMFGQLPLSQMVCSLWSDTILRTFLNASPVGSLTLNHLGFGTRCFGSEFTIVVSVID
jgi:hypothetical protein